MMQALWLADKKASLRHDVPVPAVPHGEALVRVTLSGKCIIHFPSFVWVYLFKYPS
jgi:D-arabinose 1-dehydrogenase-like Zn-dependent alcohol dehydrogenase